MRHAEEIQLVLSQICIGVLVILNLFQDLFPIVEMLK